MRAELDTAPARHVRYQREYLGWGVFVLMNRVMGSWKGVQDDHPAR
jgi:hypothetical protein